MDQIDALEQEYITCCNMRYHLYLFECALWRTYNDNSNRPIMDMITTAKSLQWSYAYRANEIREQMIALGWD